MANNVLVRPAATSWMSVLGGWIATIGAAALVAPAVAGIVGRISVAGNDITPDQLCAVRGPAGGGEPRAGTYHAARGRARAPAASSGIRKEGRRARRGAPRGGRRPGHHGRSLLAR